MMKKSVDAKQPSNEPISSAWVSSSPKPCVKLPLPGSNAGKLLLLQKQLESSGVSYPQLLPLVPQKAHGPWVLDVDGNIFLDLAAMAGPLILGHNFQPLSQEFRRQSVDLITALDYPTNARVRFLEKMHVLLRKKMDWDTKCHLTGPTGTNAVEAAIKLAQWYTKAPGIISIKGSYHGMTWLSALVSDLVPREHYGQECETLYPKLPFPHPGSEHKALDRLEALLASCETSYAAVILEPIQGEGGVRALPKVFLSSLSAILKRSNILLIADEVQTGFGRCGYLFAMEQFGIQPDIIAFSKAASGIGAPLGGIIFSKALDGWPTGSHIGTFRGFVPALASGAKFLDLIETEHLLGKVLQNSAYFEEQLKKSLSHFPFVKEIRVSGYLIGIEIGDGDRSNAEAAKALIRLLFNHGLITEQAGVQHNTIKLLPPLNLSKELIDLSVEILRKTFQDWQANLSQNRQVEDVPMS